jgi:hypothetical protein
MKLCYRNRVQNKPDSSLSTSDYLHQLVPQKLSRRAGGAYPVQLSRRADSPIRRRGPAGRLPRWRRGTAGLLPQAAERAGGASPQGGGECRLGFSPRRRRRIPSRTGAASGQSPARETNRSRRLGDGSGEGVSCKNTMGRRALKCKKRVSRSCPSDERWLVQIVGLHGCTDCWFAQDTLPFYPVLHQ